MAKNKNLEFLKSNYTIRKTHKSLNNGTTVYERDFMVTTNNGGWDSGSIPLGEGNFKIVHRDDRKESRKHNYGKFLKTESGSEFWTMDDIKQQIAEKKSSTSDESHPKIKPVYKSLLDFAYFGNCVEMIKASVKDIISKYPGEMCVTSSSVTYFNETTQELEVLGSGFGDLYLVNNPYNIDIYTPYVTKTKKNRSDYKELQYFCESRNKYKILDPEGNIYCEDNRWIVQMFSDMKCLRNGDYLGRVLLYGDYDPSVDVNENFSGDSQFVLYIFYANDEIVYVADSKWEGFHIRPITSAVDDFYDTLDDFEKFLLNRDSIPLYTITIDSMEETERGFSFGKKTFTWPTLYGWNLDVETINYKNYLNGLLELATFYDAYYSDNLWRMMVHDSIKSMDLTFSNPSKNEDKTDYNIGTTRVQGLFWAISRMFDDIKRSVDSIGHINEVTYSQANNISDYFLTDKLELNGWETYDPTATLDTDTEVDSIPIFDESGETTSSEPLYPGVYKKYTLEDVKSLFYSELIINSKDIFARKGTRQAIEMLMSLFGLSSYDYGKALYMALPESRKEKDSKGKPIQWDKLAPSQRMKYYDYELNEFVAVVSNTSDDVVDYSDELPMEELNRLKTSYVSQNEFTGPVNPLQGLPVREITIEVASTDESEVEYKKYLVPWFDKKQVKDGNMYFQMYGGWADISIKKISEEIAPNVTEIQSDKNFKVYSETQKYLKYKSTINDLLHNKYDVLKNGDIYYVNNISDIIDYDSKITDPSNYFILKNKDNFTELGENAWKNIPLSDIQNGVFDGIRVLYLESLIDDNKGNNPHVGYGDYDDGAEYINYFRQIFKYTIDSDTYDKPTFVDEAYDCETGKLRQDIIDCGFTVSNLIRDNMKVWYFTPDNSEPLPIITEKKVVAEALDTGKEYTVNDGYEFAGFTYDVYVGEDAVKNKQTKLTTDLQAFNLETQENNSNSEASADSIINVKNLEIKFTTNFSENGAFKEYLYKVIVPYLLQIIPSTTICRIYTDGVDYEMAGCKEYAEITGTADENETPYFSHEIADEEMVEFKGEIDQFKPEMW